MRRVEPARGVHRRGEPAVAGLILLHYGIAKLFKFPPVEIFENVTPLSLWGVAGMILFIPLLGILKIICDHIDFMIPFGYLLGDENDKITKDPSLGLQENPQADS